MGNTQPEVIATMAHISPPLSSEAMSILEQSLLKVPVEAMRKNVRLAARSTDKELAVIEGALKRTTSTVSGTKEDKLRAVENAIARMKQLKRKLEDVQSTQQTYVDSSKSRINYLNQLKNLASYDSRAYTSWASTRLNRQLVDYLLRRGYSETAELLALDEGSGSIGLSDVEIRLFKELKGIENALQAGSASEALGWCKDNASALKKTKSTLEFDLRFQEFIELARQGKKREAIAHCKKHLVPAAAAAAATSSPSTAATKGPITSTQRIRQSMALLAFGPDTECPPYRALYDASRWIELAATFRRAFLNLYALPPLPLLNLSLWAGLVALKLPSCFAGHAHALAHDSAAAVTATPAPTSLTTTTDEHNPNCPTCDAQLFGALARAPEVPSGHQANSIIVCRVTGKVLAGEDTLYALPNGRVYSGEACEMIAKSNDGRIVCPRTKEGFEWHQLKKVYIT